MVSFFLNPFSSAIDSGSSRDSSTAFSSSTVPSSSFSPACSVPTSFLFSSGYPASFSSFLSSPLSFLASLPLPFSSDERKGWASALHWGTVIGGVALLWYVTGERRRDGGNKKLDKEELLTFLKECAEKYHSIFTELATMAQNVKRSLRSKGIGNSLPQKDLEAMLMQEGFQERLKQVQNRLLMKFDSDEKELQKASERHSTDNEVVLLISGFKSMYSDAVKGVLPLLPHASIPTQLTQGKVLTILSELNQEKQKLFSELFSTIDSREHCIDIPGAGPVPTKDLQEKLQAATEKAETTVMDRYKTECGSAKIFQHAVAYYSREEEFKRLKLALEELHSDAIVEIMRPKRRTGSRAATPTSNSNNCNINHIIPTSPNSTPSASPTVAAMEGKRKGSEPMIVDLAEEQEAKKRRSS